MVTAKPANSTDTTTSLVKKDHPAASKSFGKNKRKRVVSAFAASLAAFATINTALAFNQLAQPNPEITPYRGWSWWTVHDVRTSHAQPNMVLLGSSLMVAAIAECDANFRKQTLDLATYRGAAYLDKTLKERFGEKFSTLNISAPGQMPSDAYLTLRAALKEGIKPKTIVYGLAPRDFIDGTLQSPSDTEGFKYLNRCVELGDVGFDYYASPLGKLEWLMLQKVKLYRLSMEYRMTFEQYCRSWFIDNGMYNLPAVEGPKGVLIAHGLRKQLRPFDIGPGTFMALQTAEDHLPVIDNTQDYQARYRKMDKALYQTQFQFLSRIIDLCADNKIKLILVQMPITEKNVNILKPQVYAQYQADVAERCRQGKITLLDLCKFEDYTGADYRDTVHLNGYGGKKFVDNLVKALPADAHGLPVEAARP